MPPGVGVPELSTPYGTALVSQALEILRPRITRNKVLVAVSMEYGDRDLSQRFVRSKPGVINYNNEVLRQQPDSRHGDTGREAGGDVRDLQTSRNCRLRLEF
jgi:hypothetical protein